MLRTCSHAAATQCRWYIRYQSGVSVLRALVLVALATVVAAVAVSQVLPPTPLPGALEAGANNNQHVLNALGQQRQELTACQTASSACWRWVQLLLLLCVVYEHMPDFRPTGATGVIVKGRKQMHPVSPGSAIVIIATMFWCSRGMVWVCSAVLILGVTLWAVCCVFLSAMLPVLIGTYYPELTLIAVAVFTAVCLYVLTTAGEVPDKAPYRQITVLAQKCVGSYTNSPLLLFIGNILLSIISANLSKPYLIPGMVVDWDWVHWSSWLVFWYLAATGAVSWLLSLAISGSQTIVKSTCRLLALICLALLLVVGSMVVGLLELCCKWVKKYWLVLLMLATMLHTYPVLPRYLLSIWCFVTHPVAVVSCLTLGLVVMKYQCFDPPCCDHTGHDHTVLRTCVAGQCAQSSSCSASNCCHPTTKTHTHLTLQLQLSFAVRALMWRVVGCLSLFTLLILLSARISIFGLQPLTRTWQQAALYYQYNSLLCYLR